MCVYWNLRKLPLVVSVLPQIKVIIMPPPMQFSFYFIVRVQHVLISSIKDYAVPFFLRRLHFLLKFLCTLAVINMKALYQVKKYTSYSRYQFFWLLVIRKLRFVSRNRL